MNGSAQSLKRIAVVGSNSFSGSDFIDVLLETGAYDVLGMSRSPEKGDVFLPYRKRRSPNFRFVRSDLNSDLDFIFKELDEFEPEAIVNFAAQSEVAPSWAYPEQWFQTNAVALTAFIHRLKDRKYLKKYLHISSPEVYGDCVGRVFENAPLNPSTPYAASKAAADLSLSTYFKNFDFPLVSVRATNVYGAHQQLFKIIPRSVIRIKRGEIIELHGGGTAVKSYIHIRDISHGELAILERGTPGELYHLSPDSGYAVRDVVERICRAMGEDVASRTISVSERLGQDAAYVIDSTKARSAFGWRPRIGLDEGLADVISWINECWPQIDSMSHDYVHQP